MGRMLGDYGLLLLVLAGCGRTALWEAESDAGQVSPADAAVDEAARPRDARVCRWTGFAPQVDYSSAGDAVTFADMDGDGRLDVVLSGSGALGNGWTSVFLNRRGGVLAPAVNYPAELQARSVAVGEFTGDGKPDFVTVNNLEDMDLFVNQGSGAFAPFVHLEGPQEAVIMTAGDFDRDGHSDLAVTTQMRAVAVLLGDGRGGFAAPVLYPTGTNVDAIAVGDLNRDGFADIVVTNTEFAGGCPGTGMICSPTHFGAGTVGVLINRGDGTFAAQVSYAAGNGTDAVALGDLDGDGAPEIVATNTEDDTLSVFFNAGDGSFAPAVTYTGAGSGSPALGVYLPNGRGNVVAADFDGDGHVDVAVVQEATSNNGQVLLLANAGEGTLRAPITFPITGVPGGVAAGDLNGDGLPDLVVTTNDLMTPNGTMAVLMSKCE